MHYDVSEELAQFLGAAGQEERFGQLQASQSSLIGQSETLELATGPVQLADALLAIAGGDGQRSESPACPDLLGRQSQLVVQRQRLHVVTPGPRVFVQPVVRCRRVLQ